jgi:tetratricopeptide (TPR) repeat protein
MRSAGAIAIAIAIATPLSVRAEEASSSPEVARAEAYASQAFAAYTDKAYQEAIVLYLKSLEAAPSANVLYNLARIYDTKVGDRELAMRFYRRYVGDPGADPERVRVANERLQSLRELETLTVEAATSARADGRDPQATTGKERRLSRLQVAGLVIGVAGLGGLGVGAGFGLAAKADADVAKNQCDGNDCTSQRGVDAAHHASDAATIATASFIAGGALSLAGAALLVWGRNHAPRRDTASVYFLPSVSTAALGGQLTGRW